MVLVGNMVVEFCFVDGLFVVCLLLVDVGVCCLVYCGCILDLARDNGIVIMMTFETLISLVLRVGKIYVTDWLLG